MPDQDKLLKKHVGTVHTYAPLSLVQRKAFSSLVYNAYPNLLTHRTHEIPVDVLCDLMGFDSKNTGALENSLVELAKTTISWDDGEGSRRKWAVTTFCAYAVIEKGVCRYEFSEFLAKQLFNPGIYARINMSSVRDFQTRYGLALYENCARYRPNGEFEGGTPEWSLDQFRRLMGITEKGVTLYDTFKRLNERIIKPAVHEVNNCSDILIEPRFAKIGRSVSSVGFSVKNNPQLNLKLSVEVDDRIQNPLIAEMENRYRVPYLKGWEWMERYGEQRFKEVLQMINNLMGQGKVKSPVGFIRRAFEENYTPALDVAEERKKVRAQLALDDKRKQDFTRFDASRRSVENEIQSRYRANLSEIAFRRYHSLPAAEQKALLDALCATDLVFKDRITRKGPVAALEGPMAILFGEFLSEQWGQTEALPFERWKQESGLSVETTETGYRLVETANGVTPEE